MRATFLLLAYNQQDYVAAAVRAALAQVGAPLHILISDDASQDDTFAVIQATVAGYDGPHHITLNRNPQNLGIAGHINAAMARIDTDYVIAAAADDISAPDRSQRLLECFDQTNALLVHSRSQDIDLAGRPLDSAAGHHDAMFFQTTQATALATAMDLYIGATGAWHRDLFQRFGGISQGCYEDLVLGYRAALLDRVGMVDAALVQYRVGQGVSAAPAQPESLAAWCALRLKELGHRKAVFAQRLQDNDRADHPDRAAIAKRLQQAIRIDALRIASYHDSGLELLRRNFLSAPFAMGILASEWNKRRRAKRAIDRS